MTAPEHEPDSSIELGPAVRELLSQGQRIARLATTRKNGHPWVQPLWYALEGQDVIVVVTRDSITARCLRRTGRAALCVDDEQIPYRVAVLECSAELDSSEAKVLSSLSQLIRRYRPDIEAEAEIDKYVQTGVLVATLRVDRVFFTPQVVSVEEPPEQ